MNCKEAAQAIASGEKHGVVIRFKLRFHLVICAACRRYEAQMEAMQKRYAELMENMAQRHADAEKEAEKKALDAIRKGL